MTPQLAAVIAQQWRTLKGRFYTTFLISAAYRIDRFESRILATYGVEAHVIDRADFLNSTWFDHGRIAAGEDAGQRF